MAAKIKLRQNIEELELINKQLDEIEQEMAVQLAETGYGDKILAIKVIGVVTAASFLGEVGDLKRFESARQISNMAGYNLTEDSSGKNKSGTGILSHSRENRQ